MAWPYRRYLWIAAPLTASFSLLGACTTQDQPTGHNTGEVTPDIGFVSKGEVTHDMNGRPLENATDIQKTENQDFSKYYRDERVVFNIEPTIHKGKIFMRKTEGAHPPQPVVAETERLKEEVGALKMQVAQTQSAYDQQQQRLVSERQTLTQEVGALKQQVAVTQNAYDQQRQAMVSEISGLKSNLRQVEASRQVLQKEIAALAEKQEMERRITEERRQAARDARAESFMEELEIRKKLDDIRRAELLQTAELQKQAALESERRLTMLESERSQLVGKIDKLESELGENTRASQTFEVQVASLAKQLDKLDDNAVRRDEMTYLSQALSELQRAAARKDEIQGQNLAIESRLLAMQNHIEGVKALADSNRDMTFEQRRVVGRIADLSKGIDAIQYQLDSQNSISAAAQAALQNQLASLNSEFDGLRQVSASKGDVGATRALIESRAGHLGESIAILQRQLESGQEMDNRAQQALLDKVDAVGINITALNREVERNSGVGDDIQVKLASLTKEFDALSDIAVSKEDLAVMKADLEDKIFSMKNANGLAMNSGDFVEDRPNFAAIQNGEEIDGKNLQVAMLQPPSLDGTLPETVKMEKVHKGYIAETPMENWIDIEDYQVVVHAENETVKDILDGIVHEATPFTGPWEIRWKLQAENQDVMFEKFSLNAETSFSDFANYVSSYMNNYRGFKLNFNLFKKERIILVTDGG